MKLLPTVLLSSLLVSISPMLSAASPADGTSTDPVLTEQENDLQGVKSKIKKMSPEQRQAAMANAKKKWDSLSDTDKQAFREKNKDRVTKLKERLEKRHQEMMDNDGERLYIRLYAIEQIK